MHYSKITSFFLLSILITALTACGGEPTAEGRTSEGEVEAPILYVSESMNLLQGTWQDLDEPENTILFIGEAKRDIFPGVKVNDVKFVISDNCQNETKFNTNPIHDKYLTVPERDRCYFINKLSKRQLEMTLVGQTTRLRYKKIK